MRKIVLSTIAALAVSVTSLSAAQQFYVDEAGQVFTTSGPDRIAIENTETPVFSKTSKIEFSGLHYLGYTFKGTKDLDAADVTANGLTPKTIDGTDTGTFEFRRNYLQTKAFLFEDPKSYARVTLDATSEKGDNANMYVKYAYIYLNEVLPFTGVEFGVAHRPWIDYEEHQGWLYRSISKVLVESKEAADLTNSADLGVNFKTKTNYFTSEIGVFNGEGYHGTDGASDDRGTGNSLEWRLTAAMTGNGTKHRHATKDTYFDASFFGQYNVMNSSNEEVTATGTTAKDYAFYGLHTVYNTPSFLLSAQYVKADNDNETTYKKSGVGYSANGIVRLGDKNEFELLARYDHWTAKKDTKDDLETQNFIYGAAWQQNKNLKWLLTGETYKALDHGDYSGAVKPDWNAAMLTAEVKW
jgi:hypothetical protein